MRATLIVLLVVYSLMAKDNFVFPSYHPKVIDKRLKTIEKELHILKSNVKKTTITRSYERKITKKTHSQDLQIKELQRRLNSAQASMKRQARDIRSLSKKIAKQAKAKTKIIRSTSKTVAVLSKTDKRRLRSLEKKLSSTQNEIGAINKHLKDLSDTKMMPITAPTNNKEEGQQEASTQDLFKENVRVEMLEQKIATLEKKLERTIIDQESNAPYLDALMLDPKIKYGLFGIIFAIMLSFIFSFVALGRAKNAISKTNRLSEIVSRSKN